jgi:ATP/maltotriose-dependent transcriptional regulator MalT
MRATYELARRCADQAGRSGDAIRLGREVASASSVNPMLAAWGKLLVARTEFGRGNKAEARKLLDDLERDLDGRPDPAWRPVLKKVRDSMVEIDSSR